MKIAFYHELHKGGARRGTNEFAYQLKKRGHSVDLFTIEDVVREEKEFYTNIFSYKFYPKKWVGGNVRARLYKDTIELFKLCLLNKKIANVINESSKHYDLAYVAASQYIESPFILNFLKVPSFFYCNDPYYRIIYEPELFKAEGVNFFKRKYEQLNRLIRKYLDIWNIHRASYIISISKFTRDMFARVYGMRGDVIHYGVNTSYFDYKKTKKEFDLLFIGSYDFLDGYPFFENVIKKMKTNPKVRVVAFENEWLSDNQLLELYRKSRIFVAVSYKEPLGMVPMEILSCGVPVVAVNEGGHRETVIDGKTGYLIKRDVSLFAKKLDFLLRHKSVLDAMGKQARRDMVENWDWKVKGMVLEQYLTAKLNKNATPY